MLISFRHAFVFLANPRCGSQSIRAALAHHADIKGSVKGPLHPHACLRSVERYLEMEKRGTIGDYFVFTTVRNPWERMVSIYHFGLSKPRSIWHQPVKQAGSFHAFCQHEILDTIFRPKPGQTPSSEGAFDVVSFGSDSLGTPRAKVFDIGRIGDVEAHLTRLGIEVSIPHLNATEHGGYASYYDDASRERVAHLFERDIDLMGYTFERRSNGSAA